ncbi:DUF6333 family protein [Streptomyces sp. NPDC048623]|uniref:DUF6333 family protein n=1 Tax=Streptomyces sp. NPDC048623 TaxID=3155761 RepID=UPI00341CF47B
MTDDEYWTYPPEQGLARYGEFRLTMVEPPYAAGAEELPEHDPGRAREFAAGLRTVAAVVDEEERIGATERMAFGTREDLGLVGVGCWGPVSEANDPALAFAGGTFPLAEQADELVERFPGAVVIGSATVDHPLTFHTHVFHHPSGARLFAAGWAGEEDWDVEGSPYEIAEAFGIPSGALAERGVQLGARPGDFAWEGLTRLALRSVGPLLRTGRELSVFRVRRTEGTAGDLEETWIDDGGAF